MYDLYPIALVLVAAVGWDAWRRWLTAKHWDDKAELKAMVEDQGGTVSRFHMKMTDKVSDALEEMRKDFRKELDVYEGKLGALRQEIGKLKAGRALKG